MTHATERVPTTAGDAAPTTPGGGRVVTRRGLVAGAGAALVAASALGRSSAAQTPATPAPGGATRTVEHALGVTEVPSDPQRVVVLDTGELDTAITLGIMPAGAVTTDASEELLGYLQEETEGVELVGTIAQPNLEKIAALKPDLILSNKTRHEAIYDQLSQIAPTVFAERVGVVWKENFLLDARALGKEDVAKRLLADYEKRAEEFGESLGEPGSIEVSVLRFTEGVIRAYTEGSFIGTILSDIGLGRPAGQRTKEETFIELGPESLPLANGDIILYASYGSPQDSGEAVVTAGPLWERLRAVQAGKAFAVDGDYFFTGIGLTAANRVLDDLAQYLSSS